jgi:hypothetical protein
MEERATKMASRTMHHLGLSVLAGILLASTSLGGEGRTRKADTIDSRAERFACTGGVAIKNATFDGRPILWQVMDYSSGYSQLWKYQDSTVETLYYGLAPRSTSHSLNSHGLARAVNEQRTLDINGDNAWNPLRIDLDRRCTSIADVRNVLAAKNYGGGKSYPFLDAAGEGTMFEVADHDYWEYYPLNPSRLRNPDYDYSDPYNFVVRANRPFRNRDHQEFESVIDGWNHESTRRHRFAREEMTARIDDGERLTPGEVLEICRSGDPGVNDHKGVICESRSKAATIYLGIKKGEDPVFTTALYALGIPDYTIFVPAWCRLSAEDLSTYVKDTSPTIYSSSQQLFNKNRDDGNNVHPSDDEFIHEVFGVVEENILAGVLNARSSWLDHRQGDHHYADMKRLHKYACDAAYWTVTSAFHTADFSARTANRPPTLTSLGASIDAFAVSFDCNAADDDGLQHVVWDFGDGATYTGSLEASHTYSQPGTYMVSCYVEDDNAYKAANVRFEIITVTGRAAIDSY